MNYQVEKKEAQIIDIRNEVAKHQAAIVAVERLSDFIDSDACETFDDALTQAGYLIKGYGDNIIACVDEMNQAETELEQLKVDAIDDTQVRLQENVDHIADTYNNPDDHKEDNGDEDDDDDDDDDDDEDENPYDDVLDFTHRIGSNGEVKSVELLVTYGGPNIYVDTSDNKVKGYWGGKYAESSINMYASQEITDLWEEIYQCR